MANKGPGKKGKKKTHKIEQNGGKSSSVVGAKSVKDAKSKRGLFKQKPAYKGKETKAGVTTHDGKFHQVTGPVARRAARKMLTKDKALHKQDSTKHSKRIKRFATAKRIRGDQ